MTNDEHAALCAALVAKHRDIRSSYPPGPEGDADALMVIVGTTIADTLLYLDGVLAVEDGVLVRCRPDTGPGPEGA